MAYYSLLAEAVPDRGVRSLCRRLVADEVGHLRFHADFFRGRHGRWNTVFVKLWRGQFRAIFHAARAVAWWDHRRALGRYGVSRADFFQRCLRDRRWFEGEIARGRAASGNIAVGAARP